VPAKPAASRSRAPRLDKAARRQQLLEAAADLLQTQGRQAFTMERLADHAGVARSLPYAHFPNADDVLVALYREELGRLAERIVAAVSPAPPGEERLRAGLHAYFDVVRERGVLLSILNAPGSRIPELAEAEGQSGQSFVASLLADAFVLPGPVASVVAELLLGTLSGAEVAWAKGTARRSVIERAAVDFIVAGVVDAVPP
jgi:AcrR family transcriptional regulator